MSQPQQGFNPLSTYLDLLYSWDEENSQLYKSVTWTYITPDGKKAYANYAAQSREDFERLINSRIARNVDVYVGLGTQRECGEGFSKDNFPKAKRKKENIVSFKAIWLDIDIGKPKAYATSQDAFNGLIELVTKTGLPFPNMWVFSGSGLHIYWCVDQPMTVEKWHVLAWSLRNAAIMHGLKFDPQVTINIPGILRVPGSYNYKREQPEPVVLAEQWDQSIPIFTYDRLYKILAPYEHKMPRPDVAPKVVLSEKAKNFTDNVVSIAPTPSIDTVAEVCPTVRDVLARGGDGDPEPLWNQMMYLAAFTDDPETTAHRLSNQDPRYTEAETIDKLGQKMIAKASGNLGWPSCTSIAAECTTCASCPLLAQGKGPLYFAMKKMKVAPPVQPTGLAGAPSSAPVSSVIGIFPGGNTGGGGGGAGSGPTVPPPQMPQADPLMPAGYWRSSDNIVMTTFYDKKGQPYVASFFDYPVDDASIDNQTGELVFLTNVSDRQKYVAVGTSATSSNANLANALGQHGIAVKNQHATKEFFVAWIKHIQGLRGRKGITANALGWQQGNKSFTYGGFTHAESGASVAYVKNVDDRFMPKGDLKHWMDAVDLIYKNPALEVLVASAFAAPLIGTLSSASCVLSAHSYNSGHGKTTALQIAQAVWGHPVTGMSSLSDTNNAIMEKLATLKSLPSYWDELKTEQDNTTLAGLIFGATGGKGRARLKQDGTQMEVKDFATMFVTASNKRLFHIALKINTNTNAGGIRVFEMEVPQMTATINQFDASQKMRKLVDNYGNAGEAYVKYITTNRKAVDKILSAVDANLEAECGFTQAERLWRSTMTTLITSAYVTNAMQLTKFNIPEMRAYLIECLEKMRAILNTGHMSSTNKANALEILSVMQNEIDTTNLLVTDMISPVRAGRQSAIIKLIRGPIRQIGAVWMQRGDTDGRIRAHRWSFDKWLEEKGYDPDKFIRDLRTFYNITIDKVTIGARVHGWLGSSQQQWCYDMTPIPGAIKNEEDEDPTSSPSPYSTPGAP